MYWRSDSWGEKYAAVRLEFGARLGVWLAIGNGYSQASGSTPSLRKQTRRTIVHQAWCDAAKDLSFFEPDLTLDCRTGNVQPSVPEHAGKPTRLQRVLKGE